MAELDYDLICHDPDSLAVLKRVSESAKRAARAVEQAPQRIADTTRQQPEE